MKRNNFWELLLNPFTRIAGLQAFGLGLVFIILMGIIGTYSYVSFDGVIDMHLVNQMTFIHSFSLLAIDIISVVLVMWITGLIISKDFRFIDILGTMTLAKAPFIILAIAGYFTNSPNPAEILRNPGVIFNSVSFILLLILTIPVMIWNIILMINAFKISCNVKGNKLTAAFIIALLTSEIISKILIFKFL
ncbi:MAG: hypothetical protein PHS59_16420 [Paludibacter sp.]|nr:hypothetical protein [Paludibacter sp.]